MRINVNRNSCKYKIQSEAGLRIGPVFQYHQHLWNMYMMDEEDPFENVQIPFLLLFGCCIVVTSTDNLDLSAGLSAWVVLPFTTSSFNTYNLGVYPWWESVL